jgi:hypothetical protein
MTKYDKLYNFISPVTGKLFLPKGNLFIGDENNRTSYTKTIGLDNLPVLGAASITIPTLPPIPIPNPMFDPLSLDWLLSSPWLSETFTGNPETLNPLNSTTIKSNEVAGLHIAIGRLLKAFDNANMVVKSKTFSFDWNNPAVNLLPQTVKDILGLNNSFTFTNAQALDQIRTGLLQNNPQGTISSATLDNNNIWVGDNVDGTDNVPIAKRYLPLTTLTNLNQNQIWIGDANNRPVGTNTIQVLNLPDLTEGNAWVGDIGNRPVEKAVALADSTYILQSSDFNLPNSTALNDVGYGLLKNSLIGGLSIASGGATPIANDYVTPTNLQTAIATLTGEIEASFWSNVGITVGASSITGLFSSLISSAYGEYLFNNKYKPLLSENTYDETDDISKWGKGNVWFDNNRFSSDPALKNYRPGIRVVSWDSSKLFDSDLVPVSMGVFGYKWSFFDRSHGQEGFVWEAEMENDNSSSNPHQSNYRLPKKFSLRHVGHSHPGIGWNRKNLELMNYDYYQDKFNFHKDTNFTSKGSVKLPVGNITERPSNNEVGMLRFNTEI